MSNAKATLTSATFTIARDELQKAEALCLQNMHMSEDKLQGGMKGYFDLTKQAAAEKFECKAMFASFPIEQVADGKISLEGGRVLANVVLAELAHGACELVAFALAAHGFEELCENAADPVLEPMFYSGWGVGYSTNTQMWLEDAIRERAHAAGLYTSRSWCPGENNQGMELQADIAEMIDLSEIGIEVQGSFSLKPVMSVAGFIAVSDNPDIELQKTPFMV